jgi:hypothetical protein
MSFENVLTSSLNKYFAENEIPAIAYRIRQAKFQNQFCDILIDSPVKDFYCAIESKSLMHGEKKLYFSQHFSKTEEPQIERMNRFLNVSGRKGFLIIEKRGGPGRQNKALVFQWQKVLHFYRKDNGIPLYGNNIELEKKNGFYEIPKVMWKI